MAATSQGADLVGRDAAVSAGEGAGRKPPCVLIKTLRNTGLVDAHKVGKSGKYYDINTDAACFARVCVGTGKKHELTRETG